MAFDSLRVVSRPRVPVCLHLCLDLGNWSFHDPQVSAFESGRVGCNEKIQPGIGLHTDVSLDEWNRSVGLILSYYSE